MKKSVIVLLLLLSFDSFSDDDICFEFIDCQHHQSQRALGLFATIIKSNISGQSLSPGLSKFKPTRATRLNTKITKPVSIADELGLMVAMNLKNETIINVLMQILPNWQIDIDDDLQDTRLDIIVQTTRKQAILDIARSLSVTARFYKHTKPKPTLSLLKI